MKTGLNIETFQVEVILGMQVGYTNKKISIKDVKLAIESAAKEISCFSFSCTITPTTIVVAGERRKYEEKAILIKSSIYPRYPVKKRKFKRDFVVFIGKVAEKLKQERVTINFSDESIMLETKYCKNPDL